MHGSAFILLLSMITGHCSARHEYYGMLAFAMAGKGDLIKSTLVKNDVILSAYATKSKNRYIWITIINKDLSKDAKVEIHLPEEYKSATTFWLKALSVKSKNYVTLAGAEVSTNGK